MFIKVFFTDNRD